MTAETTAAVAGFWANQFVAAQLSTDDIWFESESFNEISVESRYGSETSPETNGDIAVLPGVAATPEAVAIEARRGELFWLIECFWLHGLAWAPGEQNKISEQTREAAQDFIRAFPGQLPFPKIAPDGEGGLTLAWEKSGRCVLAILDGRRLHVVKQAGTDQAEYEEGILLDEAQVLSQLLEAIDNL